MSKTMYKLVAHLDWCETPEQAKYNLQILEANLYGFQLEIMPVEVQPYDGTVQLPTKKITPWWVWVILVNLWLIMILIGSILVHGK